MKGGDNKFKLMRYTSPKFQWNSGLKSEPLRRINSFKNEYLTKVYTVLQTVIMYIITFNCNITKYVYIILYIGMKSQLFKKKSRVYKSFQGIVKQPIRGVFVTEDLFIPGLRVEVLSERGDGNQDLKEHEDFYKVVHKQQERKGTQKGERDMLPRKGKSDFCMSSKRVDF